MIGPFKLTDKAMKILYLDWDDCRDTYGEATADAMYFIRRISEDARTLHYECIHRYCYRHGFEHNIEGHVGQWKELGLIID